VLLNEINEGLSQVDTLMQVILLFSDEYFSSLDTDELASLKVSVVRHQYFDALGIAVQLNLTFFQDIAHPFLSLTPNFLNLLVEVSLCRRILNFIDRSLVNKSLGT
jgi:hypothetical protein